MNIFLTGSGGFIGSHLKHFLSDTHTLFAPRSHELDILNKSDVAQYIQKNNIELILYSASLGVRITKDASMENVAQPNIKMFQNLASCVSPDCKMINLGSGAEYDMNRPLCKVTEGDFGTHIPADPYGYAKYCIAREIELMDDILNLRIFGIYGQRENPQRIITYIIQQNLTHQAITLNQNIIFDFLYILDFCKIVDFFIQNPAKEKHINVSPTESIEILSLANMVNTFSNFKSKITTKNAGYNNEYTGNNSKLIHLMGDFKFTSYQEGIHELFQEKEKEFVSL